MFRINDAKTTRVTNHLDYGLRSATDTFPRDLKSMPYEEDPLWYDRAEPDEPLNAFTIVLLSIFAVAEFVFIGAVKMLSIIRGGTDVAFKEAKVNDQH